MENIVNRSLGRYQLRKSLGGGGMGVVFLAYDPNLQRDVAIKVMHPHLLRKPGFKERFLQEAVIAARLKHPGIVQVFDSGEANGVLYIVMAFIAGGNLEEMLDELKEKGGWVLLPEAVEIIQQTCLALDYVHRRGVLHRDIKPGNIMLEPEPSGNLPYHPVLTDLGLAKLLEGGVETQTGTSMGTPAYMSPEQAQGLPVDVRSDVYSLGALLYHLCVGKPPFPAKTITEAMRYHAQQPPLPPRQANPRIPRELEAVILKTLEKDPAKRFSDAGKFGDALGKVLISMPTQQGKVDGAAATSVDAASSIGASTAFETGGGRSLATLLEKSMIQQRSPSVLDEFPTVPPKAGVDTIQVSEPGKTARPIPVKTQVITVGRTADNVIILDDPKVSRSHLRIEQQDGVYMVTDQGSSNGSFLGGVKLLKGVAQEWDPAQPLRAGDTYLKLVPAREAVGTQVDTGTMPVKPRSVSVVSGRSQSDRFSASLDKSQINIDPGGSASIAVQILNQASQVDHYQVSAEGVPADWVRNLPQQPIRCMPGQEQALTLLIQPPRSPKGRMGLYHLEIVVTCQEDPTQVVRCFATLTVAPYHQFAGSLHPERIRAGNTGRVQVINQGNTPEIFQVSWSDPANELVFDPPEAKIKVEEGQTADVEFRGRLRQGRLMGGEKSHRFNTAITLPNMQPQALPGEIISRGMIPAWLIPLFIALCVLLVAAAGAWYGLVYQRQVQVTQSAGTAVAAAQITAAYATEQNSDSDGDGLNNAREAKYDTNPSNPDTDGDGLTDGQELDVYHTDPKKQDSDDDTWTDGYEVNTGHTNPLNRDTDGDGAQDNVDPDPDHLPTFTPTATATPTPTNTPTPTPTATATPTPTNTPTKMPPQVVIKLTDFAPSARWESGVNSPNWTNVISLAWNGELNDNRGFARLYTNTLEDGTTKEILEMHPRWENNGGIKSWFPYITIPKKATFQVKVGFIKGADGTDGVTFWVFEHHSENGKEVWNPAIIYHKKGNTGKLDTFNVDISNLAGQSVSFELRVDAGASAYRDWAIWMNPIVVGEP
jgi:serine/threonine protein kinase